MTAIEYRRVGSAEYNEGDYVSIAGLNSNEKIRLPLYKPIAVALKNEKPDEVELIVENVKANSKGKPIGTYIASETINYICSPFFLSFYDNNYTTWPNSWRMGWVVRNAISHNGLIHYKNMSDPGVTWNGITVTPDMQNHKVLGNLMNAADLLILMFDMEDALNKI